MAIDAIVTTYSHLYQCYLGKKRLERAISIYKATVPSASADIFTTTWHPFYLDPTLPKTGTDPKIHLGNKYGHDRVAMMHARIKALGEAEGINFSLEGNIGNTRDAHRLIQLAKTKSNEAENRLIAELFKAHFEDAGDVTSLEFLVAVGESAGLDKAETRAWLEGGKGGDEVDAEVADAYRKGVSGVPNFTINDSFDVSGAQDPDVFLAEFIRIKKASSAGGGDGVSQDASGGLSC